MKNITKQSLKEFIGLNTPVPWHEVYVEIVYSDSGVARIYIRGERTSFYAGGGGYCKASTVLAEFLNYYTGTTEFNQTSAAGIMRVAEKARELSIIVNPGIETKSGTMYKIIKIK